MNQEQIRKFVIQQKKHWVETTERGDIPPLVMVFKDGEFVAAATGTNVDKHQGMQIASLMQIGFQPDKLLIVLDSHFAKAMPGETAEDMARKYPPGSMQKMCDEEGACEAGTISDCLVLASIDKDKKFDMDILPYDYHGKGTQFLEEDLAELHGLQ
jgi:hypothetical protein